MLIPNKRSRHGQSLLELTIGMFAIVLIVLFLLDLGMLVLFNELNDVTAKRVARSVSRVGKDEDPLAKAEEIEAELRKKYSGASLIKDVRVTWVNYDADMEAGSKPAVSSLPERGKVIVATELKVLLPVPFPGFEGGTFVAQHVEPITALAPMRLIANSDSMLGSASDGAADSKDGGKGGTDGATAGGASDGTTGSHGDSGGTDYHDGGMPDGSNGSQGGFRLSDDQKWQ